MGQLYIFPVHCNIFLRCNTSAARRWSRRKNKYLFLFEHFHDYISV